MTRRKEGEVLERHWKAGRGYALRFKAYGERRYLTLGLETDGWDGAKAEKELQNVMADVRRGIWVPPPRTSGRGTSAEEAPRGMPLFGPFAEGIVASRRGQVAPDTVRLDEWALSHLNPYFGEWPLEEIDAESIDAYRTHKVRESEDRARAIERGRPRHNDHGQALRPLAAATINQTIDALGRFLGVAVDYGHLAVNAASGRKRRLVAPPRRPVHLDAPDRIEALLEAGAELDREPRSRCRDREVVLATLVLAGPRASELCRLLWRDLDLANARLHVGRSKTAAGLREIPIGPLLRDLLAAHKARNYDGDPDGLVFPNAAGRARNKDTLRKGVLLEAFARADEILGRRGQVPLPRGLTAHRLRHTFASVMFACGEDPYSVMRMLGHTDPAFTLRVYTHMMARSEEERTRLKALVRGERVVAVEAPAPRPLEIGAYEGPILRALAERGGRAPRSEVLAAVGGALAGLHGPADREPLPSGPPRWEPRLAKARTRLVRRGWLFDGPRGAEWELTPAGRQKARREGWSAKGEPGVVDRAAALRPLAATGRSAGRGES
ncbi:MAG: tyrosine-type recombinase/integrase [Actinobacteria bacterium]|nr:tyrosine-type recombinase/integrase [Actinomycetota bacterium]